MTRRHFVVALAAAPLVLAGCAAPIGYNPRAGGAAKLLADAQKYVGLNADQTAAAVGGLFGLAQNKVPAAEWARLNTSAPGLQDLVTKGASIGGFNPASLTSMKSVYDAVAKLNVNPAQVNALSGYITNSLSGSGANSAANVLSSIWR